MSVATTGAQGNGHSYHCSISTDGRYVVFGSYASNFVAGDTNGERDIFVRDLVSGTTECMSVDAGGIPGNSGSDDFPSISADGRYVSFYSYASNLVPGDTNNAGDTFVRDRLTHTTTRVSVGAGGVQGNVDSLFSAISADGRYVAFTSYASNLVAGDTNAGADIFVRDLLSGTTERVSVATSGAQGNARSILPSISADGRFVAFYSEATTLVAGDTNNAGDIFVHDRLLGTTELVDATPGGAFGNSSCEFNTSISSDGRYVAFVSWSSNLVANNPGGRGLFVRDRVLGATERVNVGNAGTPDLYSGVYPSISADGRFVAFFSWDSTLVAGDTNGVSDVYVRDRLAGTTERESVSTAGAEGDLYSMYPSISSDGRRVAFLSYASNLAAGDTNGFQDVFVRDRGAGSSGTSFCFGDGAGTACPCGNIGGAWRGCANSAVAAGAQLVASGEASVGADTLVLAGSGMPDSAVLYVQGTTHVNGGLGNVFGDGLRCAAGTVIRLASKINSAGSSTYPGPGDAPVSIRGAIPMSGGTRTYQAWYRNAMGPCGSGYNLTNGLLVVWRP